MLLFDTQAAQEGLVMVERIHLYISVIAIIVTMLGGVWRASYVFNKKADKDDTVSSDEFEEYKENHDKWHKRDEDSLKSMNETLIKSIDNSRTQYQQHLHDIMARFEENIQEQRRFNQMVMDKQDVMAKNQGDMSVAIGKIESNLNILVQDYNHRQKEIRGGRS